MSLSPKDLLRQAAQFVDNVVDVATKPARDLAAAAGLPEIPLPKASDVVETLPDLPAPQDVLQLPVAGQAQEAKKGDSVTRIKTEPRVETSLRLRIV